MSALSAPSSRHEAAACGTVEDMLCADGCGLPKVLGVDRNAYICKVCL